MAPTARPDGSSTPSHLPRRTLIAAGAWTIPVVAAATAAPAYAASPCPGGTTNSVTWAVNTGGAATSTTQTGRVAGNTLSVSSDYNSVAAGTGSISASRNMVSYPIGNAMPPSFELSNNIPADTTPNPQDYYQTATFTFTKRVAKLTFTIEDIDSSTGGSAFWDRVAIIPQSNSAASGTFRASTTLSGTGSTGSPWLTQGTNSPGAYVATQAVDVTITGGFTSFAIRYWTTVGASNNRGNTPTASQMWIRISDMKASSCP